MAIPLSLPPPPHPPSPTLKAEEKLDLCRHTRMHSAAINRQNVGYLCEMVCDRQDRPLSGGWGGGLPRAIAARWQIDEAGGLME